MTTADNTRLTPTNKANIDPHAVTISGIVLNPSTAPTTPRLPPEPSPATSPPPAVPLHPRPLPRRATAPASGPCASSPASAPPTTPTAASSTSSSQAKTTTKANTGLSTAFDLPTLMGRDSDDDPLRRRGRQVRRRHRHHRGHAPPLRRHPHRQGHGLADHQRPRRRHLGHVPRHALQRGISWDTLGGTLQNDILKEFHSQNEFIYPPEPSVKLVVDTIEFQSQLRPQVEQRLHLRLPHPRGRQHRHPGTRLHPPRRHGVRRSLPRARPRHRFLRPAPLLLLQQPQRVLRGDLQAPRRPPHLGPRR
jgi:hypothetical protein